MTKPAESSLGEQLPLEMARVRELLVQYAEMSARLPALKQGMGPLVFMMNRSLDAAAKAMAEGDVVAMLRCFNDLKGYES